MMNAKILEKIITFREKKGTEVMKIIISQKIRYQFVVVSKRKDAIPYLTEVRNETLIKSLFLIEARAAKVYWSLLRSRLKGKVVFVSRKPHQNDAMNKMLDIGYHYLVQRLKNSFEKINMPTAIGFYHKAQSKDAQPLIYDFMEWLRPIVIDEVILKIAAKKKKIFVTLTSTDIKHLIYEIKQKFERKFYNKKLGYCISLEYWTNLIILELESSINHNNLFNPLFPSLRHETRCKKEKPDQKI